MTTCSNQDLTDVAAKAECRRLLLVISAQRRIHNQWFGEDEPAQINLKEDSAFCFGMISMFRYARGEDVPAFVVQDFIDELLKLMFCGLATDQMALAPFKRMQDRPWAVAWRLAELRLAMEGYGELDVPGLAHLLGEKRQSVEQKLIEKGIDPEGSLPASIFREIYEAIQVIQERNFSK